MMYLDCYMKNDLPGHPTATYLDDSGVSIDTVVSYLNQFFDDVKVVDQTHGQSIQNFSECFTVSNEFIELYNIKEK